MRAGHHLREVYEDGLLVITDHDVELVEVAVDDSMVSQLDKQAHQFVVQGSWVAHFAQLTSVKAREWESKIKIGTVN